MSTLVPVLTPVPAATPILVPRKASGGSELQLTLTTTTPTGSAQDMTGATMTFEVTSTFAKGTVLLSLGIGSGITYANPPSGVGILTLLPSALADPAVFADGGSYSYALWLTLPGGGPYLQAQGTLSVQTFA